MAAISKVNSGGKESNAGLKRAQLFIHSLPLTNIAVLDAREIWAALTEAHRHLAEFKGLCESLPNQRILLDTLGIQEAKDSSEIENIFYAQELPTATQQDGHSEKG